MDSQPAAARTRRPSTAHTGLLGRALHVVVSVLLALGVAIPAGALGTPQTAAAAPSSGTTGSDPSASIKVTYGTGDTVSGTWQEGVLTVGGEWVYCADIDAHFRSGIHVTATDPVAEGVWPQEMVTQIALAHDYIFDGRYAVSPSGSGRPSGSLVTNAYEQYALAQLWTWSIMRDWGYSDYGWLGVACNGVDLTGRDDGSADMWAYISSNEDAYVGRAKYYDAGSAQALAGDFEVEPATGSIELWKSSGNESISGGNDCYSLEGAVYGVYYDASCSDEAARITTDKSGYGRADGVKAGDKWVKEIEPPEGYRPDPTVYHVGVDAGGTAVVRSTDQPINDPAGVLLGKFDGEKEYNATNLPAGAASLEGAEFTVRYYDGFYDTAEEAEASGDPTRTWVFATDEDGFVYLIDSYKVRGDDLYHTESGTPSIPRGTILIQETKAPEGYNLNGEMFVQQVKKPGDGSIESTYNTPEIPEDVVRGDLRFAKAEQTGQARMAGVPFSVTSATTGESHVLVTDENGVASTSASDTPHTRDTNRNDDVPDADGDGYPDYSSDFGIWFGIDDEGNPTEPDDGKGALPYDTYLIEELPCAANEGLQLVSATAVVSKEGQTVDIGTIDDPEAFISTYATDAADGDKNLAMDEEAVVVDRVEYSNVVKGREYKLEASLVRADDPDDVLAEAEATFTAEKTHGYVNVELALSTLDLADADLVVLETMTCDGRVVAEHADPLDPAQTVHVTPPAIHTSASDAADGDKEVVSDPEARVTDVVSYTGLVPGREYRLEGMLMDKATGEPLAAGGSPVEAVAAFTPEESSGSVEVVFSFDASAIEDGSELVAFERLYRGDALLAEHDDIDDAGQTVRVSRPSIDTAARDGLDGDKVVTADPEAVIVDVVSYENVLPGEAYELRGTLMDKETGEPLAAGGSPVEAVAEFTPRDTYGEAEVVFSFDASAIPDKTRIVVFERLYRGDALLAEHADIDDPAQTVSTDLPSIATTASDAADGDKAVSADGTARVTDVVSYANLVPDKAYELRGTLMNKATGEPLLLPDLSAAPEGAETVVLGAGVYTASYESEDETADAALASFAKTSDGMFVPIEGVDEDGAPLPAGAPQRGVGLAGWRVASVDYAPAPGSFGFYVGEDGGLIPLPGKEVTAQATFTPELRSGQVEVEFSFDATWLGGSTLVAFEDLVRDGRVVASHADLADEGQTVQVVPPTLSTEARDALDGDKTVVADAQAEATDALSYTGLVPGEGYTAAGILMDKSTGLPLLTGEGAENIAEDDLSAFWDALQRTLGMGAAGAEGEPLAPAACDLDAARSLLESKPGIASALSVASAEFAPDKPEGSIELSYSFDASRFVMAGEAADVVAFALVEKDGAAVAAHADIDDEGQTFEVVPSEIATEATDKTDGDHVLLPSRNAVVVDTVSYDNLIPGKEYEVEGVLMDKAPGRPLVVGDERVTASERFVPNAPSGTVEVEFRFDASKLAGSELVVFESLSKDGIEVAAHADIDDAAQTVTVEEPPPGTELSQTGDTLDHVLPLVGAVIGTSAGVALAARRKKRKAAEEAEGEEVPGDGQ